MIQPRSLFLALALLLALWPAAGRAGDDGAAPAQAPEHVPGQLVVKLRVPAAAQAAQAFFQAAGARVVRYNPSVGYHLVEFPSSQDLSEALARLRADPAVAEADYNLLRHAPQANNEPFAAQQNQTQALQLIKWSEAQVRHTVVRQVICGLIDTGLDTTHPDLLQAQAVNAGELPANNLDDDANGFVDDYLGFNFAASFDSTCTDAGGKAYTCLRSATVEDFDGHGTGVAGVLAAGVGNNLGIAGVSDNGALIVPLKVFTSFAPTANVFDIADAITYAAGNKFRIINLSLSNPTPASLERDAVKFAADSNVLVVSAAGNSASSTVVYPAGFSYPQTLAVGAVDRNGQKASYTNFGSWVDLSAPGDVFSTTVGDGYAFWSGTSFAAPMVTGVAAMIMSSYPDLSAAQVADVIRQSASVSSALSGASKTSGLLNADAAMQLAAQLTPDGGAVVTPATSSGGGGGSGGGGCGVGGGIDLGLPALIAATALSRLRRRATGMNA